MHDDQLICIVNQKNNIMNNNWQVHINNDGDLLIKGIEQRNAYQNLFGAQKFESGLCIYSDYLRPVRILLDELFPNSNIKSIEAMEAIVKEEFCDSRSVSIFKSVLEKAQIPYRSFSNVA